MVNNFQPNAQLDTFGNWGTGVKLTLQDGTMLMLTKDVDTKTVKVEYFTVTSARTHTETQEVSTATSLFDFLHDLSQ